MNMPVAILAGGLATRLRPITERIPKILVEAGGKPLASHQLNWLKFNGISKVVYCLGHLGEQVEAAIGDAREWGIECHYSYDGPSLQGTGGAVRKALPLLGESFFVLYGDSYLTCQLSPVAAAFTRSGKPALMTVFCNENRWDTSNVLFEDGNICIYDKMNRLPTMRHIDYGLSILTPAVFATTDPSKPLDLADVLHDLAASRQLAGFEVAERFYEIGSHQGLAELDSFLTSSANKPKYP